MFMTLQSALAEFETDLNNIILYGVCPVCNNPLDKFGDCEKCSCEAFDFVMDEIQRENEQSLTLHFFPEHEEERRLCLPIVTPDPTQDHWETVERSLEKLRARKR